MRGRLAARRAPKPDPTRRVSDQPCKRWLQRLLRHGETSTSTAAPAAKGGRG